MKNISNNLFGDDFEIVLPVTKTKELINKVNLSNNSSDRDTERALKSKKIDLIERLDLITHNVLRVLGKQKANIQIIKTKQDFIDYINSAIKAGRIAIDTETNNSLDPITCSLMGLCLYYPGGKQAYIPINHRDPFTKERLSWQMTEQDCKELLQVIINHKLDIIMHNGKFDYEVLKCTCSIEVIPTWDTMVCARLLDENEPAGLKWQYVNKIDKEQEKYDIDKLFENVVYADVNPDIFGLYGAQDAYMTDRLYLMQEAELDSFIYSQVSTETNKLCLPFNTELDTLTGYKQIRELSINDIIIDDSSKRYKITQKNETFPNVSIIYEVMS